MKKIVKMSLSLIAALTLSLSLTACGFGAPTETPSEVSAMYMDFITKQDSSGIAAYTGESQTFFDSLYTESFDEAFLDGLASDPTMTIPDATAQKLLAGVKTGLGKVEYTVVSETVSGDTATVVLDVKGLDLSSIITTLTAEMLSGSVDLNDESAMYDWMFGRMADLIADAPIATTGTEVTLNLTKNASGYWELSESQFTKLTSSLLSFGTM